MPSMKLTKEWSFNIDSDFQHRIEDEDLVFWRLQQTIWITIYNVDDSPKETLKLLKQESNPNPVRVFEIEEENLLKYACLTKNEDGDKNYWELTTFCVNRSSYALMSYYFDSVEMLDWALDNWKSIRFQV